MRYNYFDAVEDDILNYLNNEAYRIQKMREKYGDDGAKERLEDEMFTEDSVTGNASGSYTFNTEKAWEYVAANRDLLLEVAAEFGADVKDCIQNPEMADVAIRCYVMTMIADKVIDDFFSLF